MLDKCRLPSCYILHAEEVAKYVQSYYKTVCIFLLRGYSLYALGEFLEESGVSMIVALGKRHVVTVADGVLRARCSATVSFFECQSIHWHVLPFLNGYFAAEFFVVGSRLEHVVVRR